MLGEASLHLVRDLKRALPNGIPNDDEETVRRVLDEMARLFQANQQDVAEAGPNVNIMESPIFQVVLFRHAVLERNKRCLLAYRHSRLMQLREMRWHFGAVLPKEIKEHLHESEMTWYHNYNRALASYMASCKLDLTQSFHPPKSLHVEVRCLENYGEFETEDGRVVSLKKETFHYLLRSDCEPLIRQGVLEHVTQ